MVKLIMLLSYHFNHIESQPVVFLKVIKIKLFIIFLLGYITIRCKVSVKKLIFIILIQMVSY